MCVRKRQVFYIPGFDPSPPRRYRELYRTNARRQAEISGYDIEVAALRDGPGYGWRARYKGNDGTCESEVRVLIWDDIVQESMGGGILRTYGQMLRTAWIYGASGALRGLMRLPKAPLIAALYPVVMLLGQALAALLVSGLLLWGTRALGAPLAAGLAVALAALWAVLALFERWDNRLLAYYLMHDYAFSAQHYGAYPAGLEARLNAFGEEIAAALAGDADEVLVVGHSSGAHLAVSVLADLLRAQKLPDTTPPLALLSLGHVVPMVSFLPRAYRLRRDLRDLSESDALTWVDVTAQGDGCTYALCDPVAVSGGGGKAQRWPVVFSAAFSQTMSEARWKEMRRRYFTLHFQYLCAFERPRDYDYFQITAGPQTLAQRYGTRPSSKNRNAIPCNPFPATSPPERACP